MPPRRVGRAPSHRGEQAPGHDAGSAVRTGCCPTCPGRRPDSCVNGRLDILARLLQHVPAPRLHLARSYVRYANAARAKRKKAREEETGIQCPSTGPEEPLADERKRLRQGWARMIRRVYEADPLLCECGETMRILSFVTDPPVVDKILRHLESRPRPRAPPGDCASQRLAS